MIVLLLLKSVIQRRQFNFVHWLRKKTRIFFQWGFKPLTYRRLRDKIFRTSHKKKDHSPVILSVFLQIPPNNKSGGRLLAPTHPVSTSVKTGCQGTVQNQTVNRKTYLGLSPFSFALPEPLRDKGGWILQLPAFTCQCLFILRTSLF